MGQPKAVWRLLAVVLLAAVLAGCGGAPKTAVEQPRPAQAIADPFALLQAETDKYLRQNRPLAVDPQAVLDKAVTGGDQAYYLVDIRNDEHYAAAYIPGAVHIAYGDAWREEKTAYLPRDKKIVVIDYSGHTASQVAAFWSMLGFDATAMKHGMAGWSREREIVGGSPLACEALNLPVTTVVPAAAQYDLPKLDSKAASLAALLADRSREATETAPVVQAKDFAAKRGEYFVADIRASDHYQAGHIEGAVSIPFRSLAATENLRKLPPDKTIVVVDYDGHAASQAARLLNQLGYHATVLKDGMSVWSADEKVIGGPVIACNIGEKPTMKLNAPLKAGPSTAAT